MLRQWMRGLKRMKDNATEIDRVFTDSDARLLRVKADLVSLSPTWYDPANTRIQVESPLPVRSEDGRLLGYASATVEGHRLVADIAIDYATPERLTIQNGSPPLYAVPVGEVKVAFHASLSDWDASKPMHASLLAVWGIVLAQTSVAKAEPLSVSAL